MTQTSGPSEPTRCNRPQCSVCDNAIREHREKYNSQRLPLKITGRDGSEIIGEWITLDGMARTAYRLVGTRIYEIKWPEGSMYLNEEGFELYKRGGIEFSIWCARNGYLLEPPDYGELDPSSLPDSST